MFFAAVTIVVALLWFCWAKLTAMQSRKGKAGGAKAKTSSRDFKVGDAKKDIDSAEKTAGNH